jgi:hypothetical protein
MNSVFALMIITAAGVVEAPNTFATMAECQAVVKRVQRETYCIEKKPVNVESELSKFIALFKNMQKEMDNANRQQF